MLMSWISGAIFHPLSDLYNSSNRLSYLRELQGTQWLPLEQLLTTQEKRLREAVRAAYADVPYYRQLFDANGFQAENFTLEAFRRLPLLTKQTIRERTDDLISRKNRKEDLCHHKTGGSTGVALTTYFDSEWLELRKADAMRADAWAAYKHGMKMAAVWGNPPVYTSLKDRLRSALVDRIIYLDTMQISDASLAEFVQRWRREQPEIVFGHSHSIFILARYLVENGIEDLRPRGIISTSMMLIRQEREVIEKAFACQVTDRYGCEEVGLIACECEKHNGMHLNVEHLYIEFVDENGQPVPLGSEGKIVVTDLFNRAMPLIRYRIEDVGVPATRACECGRGLPLMERVTGRVADYLKKPDGSLVAGVSLVERTLTAIDGIEQMQIVQDKPRELTLNVVKGAGYDADAEAFLYREFSDVFGPDMRIRISPVERIPQEKSGKYRFSICRV
jgi:phenylacetate-CoA ligase